MTPMICNGFAYAALSMTTAAFTLNCANAFRKNIEITKHKNGGNRWKPVETGGNRWKPVETGGNQWKPVETGGNRWKPVKTQKVKQVETGGNL